VTNFLLDFDCSDFRGGVTFDDVVDETIASEWLLALSELEVSSSDGVTGGDST
jgi:hypothetical protein